MKNHPRNSGLRLLGRCLPLFLLAVLIVESFFLFRELPKAEPVFPCPGVITADPSCNMRRDPNTSREVLRELRRDVKVTVLSQVEGEAVGENNIWYEIQYGNIYGYVSQIFVRLEAETPTLPLPPAMNIPGEAEFRASLEAEGFPADYQAKLMALHSQHPAWSFKALHTNYAFENAVRGEYRPGVNMVTSTAPPEYKSMAETDFNYASNSWVEYEPGWVGASEALIAYQMDPRNFLDETQIFQFENQQYNAAMDYRHGLAAILAESFMNPTVPVSYVDTSASQQTLGLSYVDLLVQAGESSGVSPYHLASRILQEVSPKGSDSVSGTYQDMIGYYNFYNIGAYGGSDPVYAGLMTARDGISGYSAAKNESFLFPWTDPARAISGGAVFIGQDYINVDQQTLYLQKFNLLSRFTRPFTHQYMGNVLAPEYEAIDVYKAYVRMGALDEAKEFLIPVFASMPAQTPSPTGGGNPNNWLRDLWIHGTPIQDFTPEKFEYRVDISSATRGIYVQALPWNQESSVYGTGVYILKPGVNEILLQVTAPAGAVRQYRLCVVQGSETAGVDPKALPQLKSSQYKLNALGYLYGADPAQGLNQAELIRNSYPVPEGYQIDVVDASGVSASGPVGTGAAVRLMANGRVLNEFPIVILGDGNGDGNIDVLDINMLFSRISQLKSQGGTAADLALDVNQDGSADVMDLNLIFQQINGGAKISQTLAAKTVTQR